MSHEPDSGQLELTDLPPAKARSRARAARRRGPKQAPGPADELPVARVAVDVSLPHLDRTFDYTVTQPQSADATPGVRVRVRFAGTLVDGFLLERVAHSEHEGRLTALASVVSPEQVLTPEVVRLARAVADRYAGTLADVLRLAVPPRHATVERATTEPVQTSLPAGAPTVEWQPYRRGPALLGALAEGRSPRAAWVALPGAPTAAADPGGRERGPLHWVEAIAEAVSVTASTGRGAIVVLPDRRDIELVAKALSATGREVPHVTITADLGPAERYRRWLQVLRGQVHVVVGTRSAVYAPVARLGLIVVWDDGDDLHAEPRAPYPHSREVAALRAHHSGCALIYGGLARTAEVARMVERGFVESVVAERSELRARAPRVRATGDALSARDRLASSARLPTAAWRTARDALASGPVLVQVPRQGYVPQLVCGRCRSRLRCVACHGPVGQSGPERRPTCQWCGQMAASSSSAPLRCPECGDQRVVAAAVGAGRTAEELGRAFPGVPVLTSGGRSVRSEVPGDPAIVVTTPGAEPLAPQGYAAALLLDAWALMGRADLRADEETFRRWVTAASLVRPADLGGRVVVVADAALRPVQALVRWDPVRFADHELAERQSLGLPPQRRFAVVSGPSEAVTELAAVVELPAESETFGPMAGPAGAAEPTARWVVTTSVAAGAELAARLRQAMGQLSVRKRRLPRVQVDPAHLSL